MADKTKLPFGLTDDIELPFDVTIGGVTIQAGCNLRMFLAVLYGMVNAERKK